MGCLTPEVVEGTPRCRWSSQQLQRRDSGGDYRIAVGEVVVNGPSSRRSVSWCVVRDVVGFVDVRSLPRLFWFRASGGVGSLGVLSSPQ